MKLRVLFLALILSLVSACSPARPPVPVGVIPEGGNVSVEEEQYGHKVLQSLSQKFEVDYNDPRLDKIIDTVDRLTKAAQVDQHPWHVYLFKAPTVRNAAATRGNHVFFWSGMFDSLENDDELATILAHEIAHVLAGHTDPDPNEAAKKLLIKIGAMAAGIAAAQSVGNPTAAQNLGNMAASLTDRLGQGILVNPYTRTLELEADHVGLMIMAQAKYNPKAALDFWKRAQTDPNLGGGSAFLSTHPLALDRFDSLQKALPLALDRYEGRTKLLNPFTENHASSQPATTPEANLGKPVSTGTEKKISNSQFAIGDERKQQKVAY